jgi:ribosomal RNA methyltransferase Nop2
MILAAIDCLKIGGILVYSTCSVAVLENEAVVDYAIRNRFVKVVDTEMEMGEQGVTNYDDKKFDQSVKLTKRIYPRIFIS